MVSTEDVYSLITDLSRSFVKISNQNFTTRAKKQQLELKYTKVLRQKAFDCILFDYDEEFCPDATRHALQEASLHIIPSSHGKYDKDRFQKLLQEYTQHVGEDNVLPVIAFHLPLANQVSRRPYTLLGYGELSLTQVVSRDLLNEAEIFKGLPMLAPVDMQRYTYYPQSLFSQSVMSVADSAFSEVNPSSADTSDPFHVSRFPIIDMDTYLQIPHADRGSRHSTEVPCSGREERLHSSLYGALTNPYVCDDLTLSLELPPIDIAPVSFDYTRQTQVCETTGKSQLDAYNTPTATYRPDSGFGEEVKEEVAVMCRKHLQPLSWELKRRVGGAVGTDREERPYLTEAGPAAFDLLYRLQLSCQLQICSTTESKIEIEARRHLYVISLRDLMMDISNLLMGVSSKCFDFDQNSDSFSIRQGLVVSGMSCQALESVCQVLVDTGTYYYRLNKLSLQTVAGLTITAFFHSLSHYLSTYMATILDISPKARSPLHMSRLLKKVLHQMKYLATLCHCDGATVTEYPSESFPEGIDLLSYIYKEADDHSCHHTYHLLLSLLSGTSQPYLRFLQEWVFYGRCSDPFEEFIIAVDPYKLETKGGKSLALLRSIVPDHEIMTPGIDPPTLDVCLNKEQQLHLTSQSTVFNEKVKAMIEHKLFTRQMMLEGKERKRVDTLKEAQDLQATRLAAIYKKMEERRLKEVRKKRQQFAELKENMDIVAARKRRDIIEEKERDAEIMEKLTQREQLETEADAELEQQAREELIEYYRLLNETAAARERKALWKVRRHQLSAIREQWLTEQELFLSEQLLRLEAGEIIVADDFPVKVWPVRSHWEKPSQLVIREQNSDQVDTGGGETTSLTDNDEVGNMKTPVLEQTTDTLQAFDKVGITDEQRESTPTSSVREGIVTPRLDTSSVFLTSLASGDVTRDLEVVLSTSRPTLLSLTRRGTKSVDGQHVSSTTFDKEYLVRRAMRHRDPNRLSPQKEERRGRQAVGSHISALSSTDSDSVFALRMLLKSQKSGMIATKESDEPDFNAVRLEKFRIINKKGHASHSSIQDILYYGSALDDTTLEEILMHPIEPIQLEDIIEDLTYYEHDYHRDMRSQPNLPFWSARTHKADETDKDVSLYEHVSLAALLQQSVVVALTSQISLSNQALLSYFMVELEFDKHMDVLHKYVLLAKGEFGLSFTLPLFEKLRCGEESRRIVSSYFLSDTLNRALQHVPMKDNSFLDNLAIVKGDVPRYLEAYSLNAFAWLSLTYKVAWPMNILITSEQLSKYEKIFSFMISLKHVSYLLADSWHSLKLSTQTHSIDSESQQFRQLHLIRHDMQHFVKVMHGYLALQVTQVSWHQFQTELKNVVDLDGLYESHNRFIGRCLSRCFLSHKVQQIKQVVDGILKSIYKFHALLRLGQWRVNEQGEFVHTEYNAIAKAYLPFKEFTQFLNKVLTKMTESDKNEHLRELQIMLNFNDYYNRPTGR